MMKKLIPSNEGVVGIVTAFLIVGLIVIVFSVVQTVYVPQWMKENEADHMEAVADQFSQLKFAIDTHCQFKDVNNPMTTSITLGNNEMPILTSSRSYGSIEILPNNFQINISYNESLSQSNFSLSGIKYSSSNAYFLDQEYIYEAGGVILSQFQGDTMVIKPSFVFINETDNASYSINLNLVNIIPVENENSISGYGNYPIKTQFISNSSVEIKGISYFTIKTEFPEVWERFLNNSFKQAGLNYTKNMMQYEDFLIERNGEQINVKFCSDGINLNVAITKIRTQITPGWID